MKIGPANNATPLIGDKQEAVNKTNREPVKEKAREDQLNISKRARELQTKYKATSNISAEFESNLEKKLDLIRLRINKEFYDKPQTKIKIAEKLSDDKEILREYYKSVY